MTEPHGAVASRSLAASEGAPPPLPGILNLITTLEPDGAQIVLLDTIRRLDPGRFRIVIGFLMGEGSALRDAALPAEIEVVALTRRGRFDPLCLPRVTRIIQERRIGIVHTHLVHAGVVGKLAARMRRVPSITTRHYGRHPKEAALAYRLEDRLTGGSAAVIAVSSAIERHLRESRVCAPEKIVMIPNGVDLAAFDPRLFPPQRSGAHAEERIVGCAGRLEPEKGHSVLMSAFARVAREREGARLEIAGEGPMRASLEARAREIGLEGKVRFLGAVPHAAMPETIARWDLFVMPSLVEGFGLAAAEAMAMERGVVASNVEGLAEVVAHDETGLLVPSGDPGALADAILALLGDPERRTAMERRGRERIAALFPVERTAARVGELYGNLLSRDDSAVAKRESTE